MKQIKFIILISLLLLTSNQRSLCQDLTGFSFTCEEANSVNKKNIVVDFRQNIFYVKEARYIKSHDTTTSSTIAFQYLIDTSKCNEYIYTYPFKRSYTSDYLSGIRTVYGQLQYHRKYKTLTFTYYKNNNKEIGRVYRYSIQKIDSGENKTE